MDKKEPSDSERSIAWYQRHAKPKNAPEIYSSFVQCLQRSFDLTDSMDRVEQSSYFFAFTYPVRTDQRSSCIGANGDGWVTNFGMNARKFFQSLIARSVSAQAVIIIYKAEIYQAIRDTVGVCLCVHAV